MAFTIGSGQAAYEKNKKIIDAALASPDLSSFLMAYSDINPAVTSHFAKDISGDELSSLTNGQITGTQATIGSPLFGGGSAADPWNLQYNFSGPMSTHAQQEYDINQQLIDQGYLQGGQSGWQRPYTDAELSALTPAEIDAVFTGGVPYTYGQAGQISQLGSGSGEQGWDTGALFGVPNLQGYGRNDFFDNLDGMTFSGAYNTLKNTDPNTIYSELDALRNAVTADEHTELGLIPSLIVGGALAGFGSGLSGLLGGPSVGNPITTGSNNFFSPTAISNGTTAATSNGSLFSGISDWFDSVNPFSTTPQNGGGLTGLQSPVDLSIGNPIDVGLNTYTGGSGTGLVGLQSPVGPGTIDSALNSFIQGNNWTDGITDTLKDAVSNLDPSTFLGAQEDPAGGSIAAPIASGGGGGTASPYQPYDPYAFLQPRAAKYRQMRGLI